MKVKFCLCGCGQIVKSGNKFIHGHNARVSHPMKGKTHSKKSKRKMSKSHTGIPLSEEHKKSLKRCIPWNKNLTKEMDDSVSKQAKQMLGNKNPAKRQEVKDSISKSLKEFYKTEKGDLLRKKIKEVNTGRPKTKEELIKISNTIKGKTKEEMGHNIKICSCRSCRARRGELIDVEFFKKYGTLKSRYPYAITFNKQFKNKIRKLYDNKCVVTGITNDEHIQKYGCQLHVHHWMYNKDETNPFYFVPVARKINAMSNFNKSQWIDMFNDMAEDRFCELKNSGENIGET